MNEEQPLTREEIELWVAYHSSRSHATRDALVQHYLPFVTQRARKLATRFDIPDVDNFIGEALLWFSTKGVARCFDRAKFRAYVDVSIRNMARSYYKRKSSQPSVCVESVAEPAVKTGCHLCGLLETLTPIQAAVLWLRFARRYTMPEIADSFCVGISTIKRISAEGMARIKVAEGEA